MGVEPGGRGQPWTGLHTATRVPRRPAGPGANPLPTCISWPRGMHPLPTELLVNIARLDAGMGTLYAVASHVVKTPRKFGTRALLPEVDLRAEALG